MLQTRAHLLESPPLLPRALGSGPKRSLKCHFTHPEPSKRDSSNRITELYSKTRTVPFHVLMLFGNVEIGSHKPPPLKSWY